MPKLLSHISKPEGIKDGEGETPVQNFFLHYGAMVDTYGFMEGSGLRYYSKEVTFHNQNGAEYHGGEQMWAWMKQLFGQFSKLQHPIHQMWDIEEDDGTHTLLVQMTRRVWIKSNDTDKPDVSAPAFWACKVGPADEDYSDAHIGLQFKEVWIYWDTMLLAPHLHKDAVAFKTKNIIEQ
jgi:hypothetical protein